MSDDAPAESSAGPHEAADVTHPGGMRAKRVFPTVRRDHLDPFVVFERFYIEPSQGFGTHPHRGFEIVSYVLEGAMAHEDSLGHASTVTDGDAMGITTGSGMRHSEMPAGDEGCSGLQLWVNLPREKKGVEPSFRETANADLPVAETDGATVTTVVGEGSPLEFHTPLEYLDVSVADTWKWTVPAGWNGVLYVVSGSGTIDGQPVEAATYHTVEGGGTVPLETRSDLRVVAVAGEPHGEPIRQRGPVVE